MRYTRRRVRQALMRLEVGGCHTFAQDDREFTEFTRVMRRYILSLFRELCLGEYETEACAQAQQLRVWRVGNLEDIDTQAKE